MVELAGDYEFSAPQELVWDMFQDPDVLARVMPGCKKLERIGDNEFQGQMNIKVGPVQGVFQGTLALSELQAPQSCHLVVNGRGSAGIIRGEGDLQLKPTTAGTLLTYEGQGEVSGRMATVGQRLMESSAKSITNQSLLNFEKQIQARLQPVAEAEAGTAVSPPPAELADAPDQTEFMLSVAKDVVEDLIPDPKHRQLLAGFALALVTIALFNAFANLIARRVAKILQAAQ